MMIVSLQILASSKKIFIMMMIKYFINRYRKTIKNVYFSYKWRTVPCNESHHAICSFRMPPCPDSFSWGQEFSEIKEPSPNSDSCFHIPEHKIGNEIESTNGQEFQQSLWSFRSYCSEFGAYLTRPRSYEDMEALVTWLDKRGLYQVLNAMILCTD